MNDNRGAGGSDTFSDYQRQKSVWEHRRWFILIIWMITLLVFLSLPIINRDVEDHGYWTFIPIPVGFTVILLVLLDRKPDRSIPNMPDIHQDAGTSIPATRAPVTDETWGQRTICWDMILIYPSLVLLPGLIILLEFIDEVFSFPFFLPIVLFLFYLLQYWKLDIHCTKNHLMIRFNAMKQVTIPLREISSIRPVTINALREFMGWGRLRGADGAVGYISSGRVGVRVHLRDGSQYVVTVKDPQSLIDFINWWKMKGSEY